jgi:hypothetical protein
MGVNGEEKSGGRAGRERQGWWAIGEWRNGGKPGSGEIPKACAQLLLDQD